MSAPTDRRSMSDTEKPPFGGTEPCIACPREVRNLTATVHNFAWRYREAVVEHGLDGTSDWAPVARKFAQMEEALAKLQPYIDAHFADSLHSHGRVD